MYFQTMENGIPGTVEMTLEEAMSLYRVHFGRTSYGFQYRSAGPFEELDGEIVAVAESFEGIENLFSVLYDDLNDMLSLENCEI